MTTRVGLLDVNVLVALFDPDHIHHEPAHAWFAEYRDAGWATCPFTENALVRVLSNVAYSGVHESALATRHRLDTFCASGHHTFWPDDVSLRDERLFALSAVSFAQLNDVYLLGLATSKQARLVTFDRKIPLRAVIGADGASLEIVPA